MQPLVSPQGPDAVTGGVEDALEVDVEERVPFVIGGFVEWLAGIGDAGVVMDGVEFSIMPEHALDGGFHIGVDRDITGEAEVLRPEFGGGLCGQDRRCGRQARPWLPRRQ